MSRSIMLYPGVRATAKIQGHVTPTGAINLEPGQLRLRERVYDTAWKCNIKSSQWVIHTDMSDLSARTSPAQ